MFLVMVNVSRSFCKNFFFFFFQKWKCKMTQVKFKTGYHGLLIIYCFFFFIYSSEAFLLSIPIETWLNDQQIFSLKQSFGAE